MFIVLDDNEKENIEDPHSIETDESDQEDGKYYLLFSFKISYTAKLK